MTPLAVGSGNTLWRDDPLDDRRNGPWQQQRCEQRAPLDHLEVGLEQRRQRTHRVPTMVAERGVVRGEQARVSGDTDHEHAVACHERLHLLCDERMVVEDVLQHVERQHEVDLKGGRQGGAADAAGKRRAEVVGGVVGVPADDGGARLEVGAELGGEPAVTSAHIDDGCGRPLGVVAHETAEEAGAGGLPRVSMLLRPALAEVHPASLRLSVHEARQPLPLACRPVRTLVVVPTYNEADNIHRFLTAVRAAAPTVEILVVDDNSPDGTGQLAETAAAEMGNVSVLHRTGKLGLGAAYRHGFEIAFEQAYDVIVSMDSDLSHDPAVIPTMLGLIEQGADVVVGSRYVPGGGTVHWPLRRQLLSKWGNRYTGFVLGLRVRDCTSGYRAYRAVALQAADPGATSAEGYAFLTELVRRLVRSGARVVETPILFRDRERGVSKMSGRIIVESMLLVTRWGVRDLWARISSR